MRGLFCGPARVIIGLSLLMLGACSNGIHDQVVGGNALFGDAKVGALSTTASYRTVVAKFDGSSLVCPEPPPDVAIAVTSSLLAQLEAGKGDITGNATLARSVAEKIAPLLKRTTALQFYRDARSYNCFAHMNGALNNEDYKQANDAAMKSVTMLMALEILKGTDQTLPEEFQAVIDSGDVDKLKELIEKFKTK
ncbi:hypothetical protein [Thalassospira mesophila]|uniref:Lipoprotein n=1 Tax=Thalassospira mesophila TaxID=1293891 RepID=A0A1Y2L3I5_9PROT|nr:hypothetical protein [Thalassospira mesophila]OSQ39784.1 hypothetical protein TMES_07525 [Thalassospira mesophila]